MPEPASDPIDGFETIAVVYSQPEAAMLLAALSGYGILVAPRSRRHISAVPNLMVCLGGIALEVAPAQVEEAIALMEEIDGGWRCPPPPLRSVGWLRWPILVVMTVMVMASPMPRASGAYRWRSATAAGAAA